MSTPFDLLGIGADADERAIKSAYAKLLRTTRPDEDAEGFQRLNEAYQLALKICRARGAGATRNAWQQSPPVVVQFTGTQPGTGAGERQEAAADESTDAGARSERPLPRPADAVQWRSAQPAQPAFNFQAFLASYREHAEADDVRALQAWLSAEPGVWHLPTKQAVGRHLLKTLFENPVPATEECLDTTLDFFKLNDALSGVDPIFLKRLKHRAIGEWHARSDLRGLAWQLYGSAASRNLLELRKIRARCERRFAWPRALLLTLRTGQYARRVGHILLKLCGGNIEDLPRTFDRESARFWLEAASSTLNRTRLIIIAFRSGLALVTIPLLAMLVTTLASGGEPDGADLKTALVVTSAITAAVIGSVWLWIGAAWAMARFDQLTYRSRIAKAVRVGFTPGLCFASIAIAQLMDPALGVVFAILTVLIAIWRYRARHAIRIRIGPLERIGFFLAIGLGSSLVSALKAQPGLDLLPTAIVACVALVVWALDMKKLYWRPSTRRRAAG
ncbi:MAG TPA: J domain-containing protein [Rhodanobacteraceae bacterium]|nr:J domain-containing protein [Rhodanobacteraceae bacterium]